jgi:lipid A 3-O-deacylase
MTSVRRGLMWPVRLAAAGLCVAILAALAPPPAHAQSTSTADELRLGPLGILTTAPTLLDFGAGVYDLIGNAHRNETGAVDAELRFGARWAGIGPAIGTIVSLRGGGMVYAGIDSDLALGPVIVTPLVGLGAWWHGGHGDENLGGTFQFRLSLAAAYAFESGARLGIRFGHISNADIHRVNPGENDLMVTYGMPLDL